MGLDLFILLEATIDIFVVPGYYFAFNLSDGLHLSSNCSGWRLEIMSDFPSPQTIGRSW